MYPINGSAYLSDSLLLLVGPQLLLLYVPYLC